MQVSEQESSTSYESQQAQRLRSTVFNLVQNAASKAYPIDRQKHEAEYLIKQQATRLSDQQTGAGSRVSDQQTEA